MAATFLQFASPFIHPESYLAANYNRPPPEVIRKYKEREDRAHSGRHRWSLSQNVCNSPERIPTWLTHREPEHQHEPAYYQSSYDAYLARSPPRSAKLRSNGAKTAYHRPGDQKDLVVDAAKLFESTAQLLKKYESPEIPLEISTDTMDRTMEVKPRSAPDLFIGWDKDEMAESQSQKQPSASKNLQAQPQPPAMPRAVSVSANAARKQEQNIRFDEPAGDQPPLHDAIMRCVKKCVVKASDDGSISLYNTPASSRPSSSRPWSRRSSRFTVEISQQELNSARAERIANLARPKSRTGINERSGPSQTLGTTTSLVASSTVTASSAPSKSATLEQPAKVSRNSSHKQPQVLTTEQARAVMNFTSNLQKNTTQTLTLADWSREQSSKDVVWDPSTFSVKRFIRDYIQIQKQASDTLRQRKNQMQAISRHHSVIGGGLGTAAAVVPATPTPAAAPPPLRRRTTTHAGVDARRLGSLAQDHSDQEASVAILQKSRFERTAEDVKVLFKFLRKIKAFAKVSDFILEQLCKVGYYQSYAADRAVFRQGEVGTAWYILLHGSVVVQVSQTGRIEDSVPVTKLYAGEGFGDLALTNDKPRTASIITAEPCEVVYIEKEDYKVVYFIHEKEMKEKMMFLRKVPLFHDWAAPSLRSIAQYINWRKHLPGTVIVEEGSDVEEFFIIRSGTCTAHRTLPPSITEALNVSPKHASVQVGMIHSLQYFGTEGVVGDGNLPPPTPARYTIRASAEGIVQTAVMTVFDAKTNFRGAVEELRFPGHSDERELLKIYEGNIAQRKWYRTRKAVIKELAKEWTGDPLAGQSSGPWRVFHDEELEGSTPTWRW